MRSGEEIVPPKITEDLGDGDHAEEGGVFGVDRLEFVADHEP